MIAHAELRYADHHGLTRNQKKHYPHMVVPGYYLVSSKRVKQWFAVRLDDAGRPVCECGPDCCHAAAVSRRLERARLELSALPDGLNAAAPALDVSLTG